MPRQRQRRPRREDVVTELLDAAARVFAESGYDGSSVEQISERAGYSTGALYSNFKSKEELFLRLFENRNRWRAQELRDAMTGAGGGRKGLVAAAANFSAALDSDREWYLLHLEFALRAARDPKFATLFRETRAEAARIMAAAISEALGEEGLSSALKTADLARSVRALVHGFALERILGERSGVDPLPGEIMRLVFRGATGYAPS